MIRTGRMLDAGAEPGTWPLIANILPIYIKTNYCHESFFKLNPAICHCLIQRALPELFLPWPAATQYSS
ncbi:hypothetical protein C1N53_07560 [Pontibacter sp. SGAir0037]|nr:hypothetical protein C1N53_07560 [Pontibacter sp. SGAir0037]